MTQVVAVLVLGIVLIVAIDAVFAPWSFYMGGDFHWFPMWQGWGRMHSQGGDYLLYVSMQPRPGSRGVAHVQIFGNLCTPRGELIDLKGGADFEKHMGSNTDGKRVFMYLSRRRPAFYVSQPDTRPTLQFLGAWHNPDMVLDDHGTISREFLPDGSLYSSGRLRPPASGALPLTLKEGSRSDFETACKANQGH